MTSVPFLIKSETISFKASLALMKSTSEEKEGEVVSSHLIQRLLGILFVFFEKVVTFFFLFNSL
jgi:hypothetical protein